MPDQPSQSAQRFTRRVGLFTLGTLISRLGGLVRESVFAWLFGAGLATDAFNVAFRIPNFFRDLFAESALSAAFVPTLVQTRRDQGDDHARRLAANLFNTITILLALIVIAGIILAPQIVRLIAWGFRPEPQKLQLTISLTRIMFPFLLFVALAAWAMGILNASGSFFIPAVAPAAFNLISIAVPLAAWHLLTRLGIHPITGMAYGVMLGALLQFLIQVPKLHALGFRWHPVLDLHDPALHQVFRRWVPMVLGLATWQINFLVNTFLLTFLPEGSVTWVSYAYRIQHLPAGLFGVAIGTVALAQLSQTATSRLDEKQFSHGLNLVSVLTLPAAVLLFVLAVPVVRLIYQHGRFTAQDTVLTAQALALYALGVWPAAAVRNCAAGFYALGNTRTPALIALLVVTVNILFNLIFMRLIGFRSFPLAASFTQLLNFSLLFYLLNRRQPGLIQPRVYTVFLRTLGAAIPAGIASLLIIRLLSSSIRAGITGQLLEVLLAGTAGVIIFYLLARLFRLTEVQDALNAFIHRR
ncbi:MAG: murein biosynthesis integral membrane protein MurJ [candidate division WOR-3 bacterium]|uniref:Probable lipid II flippase MurJ n=2 Tax=Bacteria TaxID=2 RepID=A0A7C1NTP1_UNCW3|nr:murein biosynthesis integral membrane protein MurJ [candidate division WOR-3 bacterium]